MTIPTYIRNLVFFVSVTGSSCIVRTWKFNTNFNKTDNWDKREIPCKTSVVVFPVDMRVPVELPTASNGGSLLEIRKLVLSRQGSLIFSATNGGLTFFSEERHASCSGGEFKFVRTESKRWADPDNWSAPTRQINIATPHLERIPCKWDDVVFPPDASFYISLPNRPITVSSVTMQGTVFVYQDQWSYFLSTLGWRFFPGFLEAEPGSFQVTGEKCEGCECGNSHISEDICTGKWKWQEAQCADPVTPIGFCFPICGAFLLYKKTADGPIDIVHEIRGAVENYLRLEGKDVDVVHSTSRTNGFIQIVLMDKDEYSADIKGTAKGLHLHLINKGLVKELSSSVQYSGLKISHIDTTEIFNRFLLGFLCSIIGFAVVFCSYEKNRFTRSMDWNRLLSLWSRDENETLGFARFENASGRVEIGEEASPSKLTLRQTSCEKQRGFDNPMFSENLQSSDGMALREFDGRRGSLITLDTDIGSLAGSDSTSDDELSMKEVHLEPVNLREDGIVITAVE